MRKNMAEPKSNTKDSEFVDLSYVYLSYNTETVADPVRAKSARPRTSGIARPTTARKYYQSMYVRHLSRFLKSFLLFLQPPSQLILLQQIVILNHHQHTYIMKLSAFSITPLHLTNKLYYITYIQVTKTKASQNNQVFPSVSFFLSFRNLRRKKKLYFCTFRL